jgi:deoxyxylulose-5-phosphate synthase
MALGAKHTGNKCHVYTIIGDGESQEGLVWEASMAAAHYKLDNLTVILDHNGLQIDGTNDEVMSLGDIRAKAEEKKVPFLLSNLYEYYEKHIDEMPSGYIRLIEEGDPVERVVCDYISGMTDSYALEKFVELFTPRRWFGP